MAFHVTDLIKKKRSGQSHSEDELRFLIDGYLANSIRDYHMAAWLMAVFFRGMAFEEMRVWARLMWQSGVSVARPVRSGFWVDKHSTGGVGDKTSLLLVPIVKAVSEKVWGKNAISIPMISGRGLGFSGGTLDKLDSVPGFSSDLSIEAAEKLMQTQGFFMLGQTKDLAPVDRLLYALRDVTATVECVPLIVSSILSKKFAENLDGLVFDVKLGAGAFMGNLGEARHLAQSLVAVAKSEGLHSVGVLSAMDEPLGWKVGNQLEVEECVDYLSGSRREAGLHEVTMELASQMLALGARGKLSVPECREQCESILQSDLPMKLFSQLFESQGGSVQQFQKRREALAKRPRVPVVAEGSGYLEWLDAQHIGRLVHALGGGRETKESSIDADVGVEIFKKIGDPVSEGEKIYEIVLSSDDARERIPNRGDGGIKISRTAIESTRWIKEIVR
jgi:pyrimidine-nucleoside phosphorylase